MAKVTPLKRTWMKATTTRDTAWLISRGAILQWHDMPYLLSHFSQPEQQGIVRQLAKSFCLQSDNRAVAERTIESLLTWLSYTSSDEIGKIFIAKVFKQKNAHQACWVLVEVALNQETVVSNRQELVYATAVAFVCELGQQLDGLSRKASNTFVNKELLWDHLATYLLSLSNVNNSAVRLSLLSYFASMSHTEVGGRFFARIMQRFGYTALDRLFIALFDKKQETVAFEYLLNIFPALLRGDYQTQETLAKVFKHYMYRLPQRSVVFLRIISDEVNDDVARHNLLKHLASLYLVLSEIDHHELAADYLLNINNFSKDPKFKEIINSTLNSGKLREHFSAMLAFIASDDNQLLARKLAKKRGRRPGFSRNKRGLSTLEMITTLGNGELTKLNKAS